MNLIEATIQALTGNKIEEKANVANAEINKKLLNPNANKAELQRNGYNVSREGGFTSVKRADRVNDFRELAVFDDGEVLPVTDKNIGDKTINKDAFDAKNFLDTNRKEELPVMSKVDKFKMNKDTIAQADMEIADAEIEKEVNPEDAEILDTNVIKPWKKMKDKAEDENNKMLRRTLGEYKAVETIQSKNLEEGNTKEKQEKLYEISLAVNGYYRKEVTANSEDEAYTKVNDMCTNADFGELEDIDWENSRAILLESKEKLYETENLDEAFYEKICRAYIDTMNLEWVTTNPENHDSVVHGYFANDDVAEKWEYGAKVTPENFKDAVYDGYTEEEVEDQNIDCYEYDTWLDFYEEIVKNNILYDIRDIGLYGLNDEWDFYISEEDLEKLDLIEDEDDAKTESKKLNEDVEITNAFDKTIDIENSDGDTLMSFKISSDGAIYGFENCEVADEEADSIRIQQVGSLCEYADLAENKSIKLEDISMNGILDYREIIDKDNGDLVDTFFFDHKLTADEDAKIKEAIENAKLEDDYDNYTVMEYVNKIVPIKQTLSAIYSDLGASTGKQLYY